MFADKLPEIIPAAEFRKVNGQKQMKAYNGIIELTVGPLSNKSEIVHRSFGSIYLNSSLKVETGRDFISVFTLFTSFSTVQ